jgi:hypothetical protein
MIFDVTLPKSHYCVTMNSVIKLTNNPISHSRPKHIDVRHHFLRDHEAKGDIEIHHVRTEK